jgi:hypothetical protein
MSLTQRISTHADGPNDARSLRALVVLVVVNAIERAGRV